ncbi:MULTISPECIES: COX15/CtaA family protein [Pseudomonas]|jgi:cytochrome c oxidase assembly protein subunit 15|uniref:COX15/CtaA family protein n=1 Tax=Pseudomonas quebecensis TaxID=2995174 RepID=A0ABY6QGB8_9PSED|nr:MULTISPECIES: COX15/CtaA family protein [Pseudomonas]MCP1513801.1 cytochrome c oxidase assembly protein subunit 15 [Pseudomonas rhodesiae]MCX4062845.1 COX15/CtaA family protein [Pseudomonas quebecensis]MDF9772677.1 cytochrome c oxidase assembly protein subunit 15 [Pseudomonas rhodesiae]UZW18456.1 COX15/CtaA family protein [Pseudomonas quebecensis]UZW24130.1 COX15/CtaA family protein [Pseudomonas quebecensis]
MAKPGFRLALFATLLALIVVLLGAYTRLTHAGLGCPDWPGCYGFIAVPNSEAQLAHAELHFPDTPVEAGKGWSEMIHRYFAGTLGLVIGVLAARCWSHRRDPGQPVKLPLFLLVVVVAQAAFGMWTVTLKLWPQVVTGHLLGGFATLSLLFLLTLRLSGVLPALVVPRRLQYWATAGLVLVIGQIALGGWVSSNYAAVACIDLPTCHGQWWPAADFANGFHLTQHIGPNYLGGQLDSEARTAIHLTHRVGAVIVTLALLGLAWQLRAVGMTRLAGLLLIALAAQIGLGLSNVYFHLPLPVAVAHNAGGAGLLLTLVLVNYHARTSLVRARSQRPYGWRFIPRKPVSGLITLKGEMPWRP